MTNKTLECHSYVCMTTEDGHPPEPNEGNVCFIQNVRASSKVLAAESAMRKMYDLGDLFEAESVDDVCVLEWYVRKADEDSGVPEGGDPWVKFEAECRRYVEVQYHAEEAT